MNCPPMTTSRTGVGRVPPHRLVQLGARALQRVKMPKCQINTSQYIVGVEKYNSHKFYPQKYVNNIAESRIPLSTKIQL